MSQHHEDKIQGLAEKIRNQEYHVDPAAVADAFVRHVCWEDVSDLATLTASGRASRRTCRWPSLPRLRRLSSVTVRTRPQLSA